MWSWKSQDTRLLGLIILEQFRVLINGLAAKMLDLIISSNFDGHEVFVVPVVEALRKNHL